MLDFFWILCTIMFRPTALSNYSLISGEIYSFKQLIMSENTPELKDYPIVPYKLSQDTDKHLQVFFYCKNELFVSINYAIKHSFLHMFHLWNYSIFQNVQKNFSLFAIIFYKYTRFNKKNLLHEVINTSFTIETDARPGSDDVARFSSRLPENETRSASWTARSQH